jgi:Cd2+/Zn2+-exporting ATPase
VKKKKSHQWLLEGIDCANCAAKVEQGVASIPGVTERNVNFMTESLRFEVSDEQENLTLANIQEKLTSWNQSYFKKQSRWAID